MPPLLFIIQLFVPNMCPLIPPQMMTKHANHFVKNGINEKSKLPKQQRAHFLLESIFVTVQKKERQSKLFFRRPRNDHEGSMCSYLAKKSILSFRDVKHILLQEEEPCLASKRFFIVRPGSSVSMLLSLENEKNRNSKQRPQENRIQERKWSH